MSETLKRRYFTADGPDAQALIKEIKDGFEAHRLRSVKYRDTYDAPLIIQRDGFPIGILLPVNRESPPGFKLIDSQTHEGVVYGRHRPHGVSKEARAAKSLAKSVGGFCASLLITDHYKAHCSVIHGGAMWVSVGWIDLKKNLITLSIPDNSRIPYDASQFPELVEIKKSEYVALTEE